MRDLIKVYQNTIIKQSYKKPVSKKKKWIVLAKTGLSAYDAFQGYDIKTWVGQTSSFPSGIGYTYATDITYFKGKYYVSTFSNYLLVSSDMVNWTTVSLPESTSRYNKSIAASSKYLAIASGVDFLYSTDGETFTTATAPASLSNFIEIGKYTTSFATGALAYSPVYDCFFVAYAGATKINIDATGNVSFEQSNKSDTVYTHRIDTSSENIYLTQRASRATNVYNANGFEEWGTASGTRAYYSVSNFNVEKLAASLGSDIACIGLGRERTGDWPQRYLFYTTKGKSNSYTQGSWTSSENTPAYNPPLSIADWDEVDTVIFLDDRSSLRVLSMTDIITSKDFKPYRSTTSGTDLMKVKCLEID